MKIEAKNVAKYFYNKNSEFTEKQIQKLTYYAYVWYLIKYKKRLFEESPQAWIHGPVFMSLYKTMQNNKLIETNTECLKNNKDTIYVLDVVYKIYGKFSGNKLEQLTHAEDPWKNARKGLESTEKSQKIITDEDIIAYYSV